MRSITLAPSNLHHRNSASLVASGRQGRGEVAAHAFVRAKFVTRPLESKAIGCNTAYAGLPPLPVTTNIDLTKSYFTSSRRLASERTALAGYRLAALLNDLYGH